MGQRCRRRAANPVAARAGNIGITAGMIRKWQAATNHFNASI